MVRTAAVVWLNRRGAEVNLPLRQARGFRAIQKAQKCL